MEQQQRRSEDGEKRRDSAVSLPVLGCEPQRSLHTDAQPWRRLLGSGREEAGGGSAASCVTCTDALIGDRRLHQDPKTGTSG